MSSIKKKSQCQNSTALKWEYYLLREGTKRCSEVNHGLHNNDRFSCEVDSLWEGHIGNSWINMWEVGLSQTKGKGGSFVKLKPEIRIFDDRVPENEQRDLFDSKLKIVREYCDHANIYLQIVGGNDHIECLIEACILIF